jgi:hypothetical protein
LQRRCGGANETSVAVGPALNYSEIHRCLDAINLYKEMVDEIEREMGARAIHYGCITLGRVTVSNDARERLEFVLNQEGAVFKKDLFDDINRELEEQCRGRRVIE